MSDNAIAAMWVCIVACICLLLGTYAWRAQDGYNATAKERVAAEAKFYESGGSVACWDKDAKVVIYDVDS